jgi:Protein of unknown function (DUF1580)
MIDPKREELRSFAQISKEHPIHPSVASLWRWCLRGIKGHHCESLVYGGRRYSTLEAVDRFAAVLSANRSESEPPASRQRQDEIAGAAEKAEAILRAKEARPTKGGTRP